MTRPSWGAVSLIALAACVASAAWAQTPRNDDDEAAVLDEVVVTAERRNSFAYDGVQAGAFRNARVLDTPLTVNVVPRAVLDAQGAQGLHDALRNTGGVTRSQLSGGTYDNLAIRGILVENRGNYRLNGSLPVINLVEQPLEDKARVEVLKGASGLYYGFVPPSGVINMTTKRPDRTVAEAAFRGDSHGSAIVSADLGRRYGAREQFGARVNLAAGRLRTGVNSVAGERYLAAAAIDWDATEQLAFKADIELIAKDISEPAAIALLPAVNGVITLPSVPDPETNLAGGWQRYVANADNLLLRMDYRFSPAWAATLEAGRARTFRERAFSQFQSYSLSTGEGTLRIFLNPGQEFVNENLRGELNGAFRTGPLRHELTIGATRNERYQSGRGNQIINVAQNLYRPRAVPERLVTALVPLNPSEITDQGAYIFDRVRWGESVQVIAGIRWSDYESQTHTVRYTAEEASPAFAVIFQPRANVSLYATFLQGLEEGGTAPANTVNAFELLPPAVSDQWEAGAKAEVAERMTVSLAGFAITRPSAFTNSQNRYVLDGEVEYRGLELFASGELTDALSLVVSGLWLDASQKRASDPGLVGRRPENTPEWTASAFAEWRPAFVEGLGLNAGVFCVGDRAVNPLNQAFVSGYATLSLGARYTRAVSGRDLTFQVNLENATGAAYWNTAGNNLLGVGQPRTVRFAIVAGL